MKAYKTVDEYILNAQFGKEILIVLREILRSTELTETIKWGGPVYTINDKNVIGLGAFKLYAGMWFYQGVFLNDEAKVLINAQEGTTKALRQWRFTSVDEIDDKLVLQYVGEAIHNAKDGKELRPDRNKKLLIPGELQTAFDNDKNLEKAFLAFTPGCQREFAGYVTETKRVETRETRVQKIIPMILGKRGLNDKYKK
ncbi:MAG: YdeI family protein [Draconibacterium sp.]